MATGSGGRDLPSDQLSRRHARARGVDAAHRYTDDPTTLAENGLDQFREASLGRLVMRRALLAVPLLADLLALPGVPQALRRMGVDALYWKGARTGLDRAEWRGLKSGVCILMYHGFGEPQEAGSRYVIPHRQLRRQLRMLIMLRRRVVALDDYVAWRAEHRIPPPRTTIITIDDGYADTYRVAAPLLAEHGFPATVFVVSQRIGETSTWTDDPPLRGRPLAGWDLLRAGRDSGVTVGGHSRTHPALTRLSRDAASFEIQGCREELAVGLDAAVTCFAYPFGDEDDATRQLVLEAGYSAACSSRGGPNATGERIDSLRRIEIRGDDPLWRFASALWFGTTRPLERVAAAFTRRAVPEATDPRRSAG